MSPISPTHMPHTLSPSSRLLLSSHCHHRSTPPPPWRSPPMPLPPYGTTTRQATPLPASTLPPTTPPLPCPPSVGGPGHHGRPAGGAHQRWKLEQEWALDRGMMEVEPRRDGYRCLRSPDASPVHPRLRCRLGWVPIKVRHGVILPTCCCCWPSHAPPRPTLATGPPPAPQRLAVLGVPDLVRPPLPELQGFLRPTRQTRPIEILGYRLAVPVLVFGYTPVLHAESCVVPVPPVVAFVLCCRLRLLLAVPVQDMVVTMLALECMVVVRVTVVVVVVVVTFLVPPVMVITVIVRVQTPQWVEEALLMQKP
ncbi:hypothetical protein HU200_061228 [Digitaria exilis]|uniref:Uncharacterized protein n=1 Tax=Digitaria exilis TaxID=1010633 RepID=A0A835A8R0_9POAL|nr:hypothetical protein HU200_061228 [Digitaria exilis]